MPSLRQIADEHYRRKLAREMSHQTFEPYQPAVDARNSIGQWTQGVAERSSPSGMLSALASEASRYRTMPPEELAGNFGPSGGSGLVGMFAGKGAKTANLAALAKAEGLRTSGVPDEQIWKETGWAFGFPDQKPRFEIPDNAASMMQDAPAQLSKYPGRRQSQIMAHDELYGAYPESADIWTGKIPGEYGGSYTGGVMGKSDMVNIGIPKKNIDLNEVAGTNLHELQHAIQQREGFARGGSPDMFTREKFSIKRDIEDQITAINDAMTRVQGTPKYSELMDLRSELVRDLDKQGLRDSIGIRESAHNQYRRLAGEAEARLTQARMNMTPEQRLANYPVSQFDVAPQDQIVRYGDGQAMSVPAKTEFELAHEVAQRNAALPVEQGGLGLPAGNTAMERAMAMGFDTPAYHGTASDVDVLNPSVYGSSTGAKSAKDAFWAAQNPETAVGYSHYAANSAPVRKLVEQANEYEKLAQRGKNADVNWAKYDDALRQAEELEQSIFDNSLRGQNVMPLMLRAQKSNSIDAGSGSFVDLEGGVNELLKKTQRQGKDVAIIRNLDDDAGFSNRPTDHYGVINPSAVRSRFAAFDPARRNSANILAGGAAGAVGLSSLADLMFQPEYQQ